MRFLILLLIAVLALVPPGICLCRLTAALVPDRQAVPHEPECPDDECDCPQLKQDCTLETVASCPAQEHVVPLALFDETTVSFSTHSLPAPHLLRAPFPTDTPLFLTLRALRI